MSRKKKPSETGRARRLKLSLDVDGFGGFHDVLTRVVQEAGGTSGLLATWDTAHPERGPQTSSYNLDAETERVLSGLFRGMPPPDDQAVGRLQEQADLRGSLGDLEMIAIPVRVHDRSVGLMCLFHPSHAAGLLKKTPGVYNIRLDEVEAVVQNARLLQRLLAERKWLEAVVAQSANGIAIIDSDGRVVGFNPAMERLSGWSLDDAVGHPVHEIFPLRIEHAPIERGLARTDMGPRLPLGEQPTEARLHTRGGEWMDVEATTTTLWDDRNNHVLGWALEVRDVRSRKEKERLERIFLSGVSHELQTPIAVIKGFSGLLSDPDVVLSPEQAREKAAIIHEESVRLERMVRQLLYATRIQAGGVDLVREPLAVGDLVLRCAQRLEPLARARGCLIHVEMPDEVPLLQADPEKVEQVVVNLLENAIKYASSDRQCPISVELRVRSAEIEISVSDSGPGVPGEERERIFHVFERGRGATRAKGSGLGLFICKAIVEAHGGRIGVDTASGGGARFYFTLPRST